MATNNSVNLEVTNDADGFTIAGGTTKRSLTVTGANIALSASVDTTATVPGDATSTLVSTDAIQTLTNKTFTSPTIDPSFTLDSTLVTTSGSQLNYLNASTGTTGTATTNLVFSGSPSIASPSFSGTSQIQDVSLTGNVTPSGLRDIGSLIAPLFKTWANTLNASNYYGLNTVVLGADTTNNYVGVNVATELSELHVRTSDTSATTRGLLITQYSDDANASMLSLRKARGTGTTAVISTDIMSNLAFQAYGTTNATRASIFSVVNGTVLSNNVPTDIQLRTTNTNSVTAKMTIGSSGTVNATSGTKFTVATNLLYVDYSNNRVGITKTPSFSVDTVDLNCTGAVTLSGTTNSLVSTNTTTTSFLVTADSLTTGSGTRIYSNSANISIRNLSRIIQDHASATGSIALSIQQDSSDDALFIDHNLAGNSLEIDADDNSSNPMYGIVMAIDNAGAGLEYAGRFNGSEIVGSAVGVTQDKKIRVSIGGTDYFIPLHTT